MFDLQICIMTQRASVETFGDSADALWLGLFGWTDILVLIHQLVEML